MIPKVVYYTHENKDYQKKFSKIIKRNKKYNPELSFKFYDNEARINFIKEHYPEFYHFYIRIDSEYGAAKADIFRVLILYHYGGIYVDIKTKIMNIYPQIKNHSFCCCTYDDKIMRYYNSLIGFKISNFFLSSKPKGKIITRIKNEMYDRLSNFGKKNLPFKYNCLPGTKITGLRTVFYHTGPGIYNDILSKNKKYKVICSKQYLIYDNSSSFIYRLLNFKKIYKNRYHISNNRMLKKKKKKKKKKFLSNLKLFFYIYR